MSDGQIPVFSPDQLKYAATARCKCGAGLAYAVDREDEPGRNWNCSKLLSTDLKIRVKEPGNPLFGVGVLEDEGGQFHDGPRPFISWDIKGEGQPSANGQTTRP